MQDSIYESNRLVQRFDLGGLWDSIADMGSSVWDMVTGQSAEGKKSSGNSGDDNTDGYTVPPGAFKVSDPNSIIRRPPPNLSSESNKPIIPEGTSVTIVEAYRKNGKYYVKVDFRDGLRLKHPTRYNPIIDIQKINRAHFVRAWCTMPLQ